MCAKTGKPGILKNWHKLLPLLFLFACSDDRPTETFKPSIYYWRSDVVLDQQDSLKLDSLGIERMYVHYFDIKVHEDKLKPVSVVEWKSLPPAHLEIVPVVYITNGAMRFLPDTAAETLALHVFTKIEKINTLLGRPVPEIQMDCDWTPETGSTYFRFLRALKILCESKNWVLSATIRLHQIKFPEKTGIPPVDRGMLMYYNMGEVSDINETNSILNMEKAMLYTDKLHEYPLELDLALPLFSWVVQFRGNDLQNLRSSWRRSALEEDSLFVKESEFWYVARDNGLFKGQYIVKNDRFRIEEISPGMNLEIINHLSSRWKTRPVNLSLFHYNPYEIENYACNRIKEIYSTAAE